MAHFPPPVKMTDFSDEEIADISAVFEVFCGLSVAKTLSYKEAKNVAHILGFQIGPALLQKFGAGGRLDCHQFVACLSVCHSDTVNHPKSKQIFTLMDTDRTGQLTLDNFVHIFEESGDGECAALPLLAVQMTCRSDAGRAAAGEKLGPAEREMIQRYIEENRESGDTGMRLQHIEEFMTENNA
jgi:Ca2+-binding EF-hand superfamily protein